MSPVSCLPVERDVNGNVLDEARCEACNGGGPAFSVPNYSGDRYQPQTVKMQISSLLFHTDMI